MVKITENENHQKIVAYTGLPLISVRDLGDLNKCYFAKRSSTSNYLYMSVQLYTTIFDPHFHTYKRATLVLKRLFYEKNNWRCNYYIDITNGDLVKILTHDGGDDSDSYELAIITLPELLVEAKFSAPRIHALMQGYCPERYMEFDLMDIHLLRQTLLPAQLEVRGDDTVQILNFHLHPNLLGKNYFNLYWGEFRREDYDEFVQKYPNALERSILLHQIHPKAVSSMQAEKVLLSDALTQLLENPRPSEEKTIARISCFSQDGKKWNDIPNCCAKWAMQTVAQYKAELTAQLKWEDEVFNHPWKWLLGRKRCEKLEAWRHARRKQREYRRLGL